MRNKKNIEEEKECGCKHEHNCGCLDGSECTCGDECTCEKECNCTDNSTCHDHEHCDCGHADCHCNEHDHHCHCDCHEKEDLAGQYLAMAQRLQADFDNYRKRVAEQLDYQRDEGKKSVISVFLPCLDTFKEAKKNIADEQVLAGINMIEEKILNALKSLKVERIESIGNKFDHNLHEVIAVMADESKENDIILEEYQAGYTFDGKVIRYSKVIVNKKGE